MREYFQVSESAPMLAANSARIRIRLPEPTGNQWIGTCSLHLVDRDRPDPWRIGYARELMVTLTYPALSVISQPRAQWLSGGMARAVGDYLAEGPAGIPKGSVDWGSTARWARAHPPVDRRFGRWPLLLFSPAFSVPRELNCVLTDELASRGFVVASISHTYESAAVEFPGGRVEAALPLRLDQLTGERAIEARVADTRFVLDRLIVLNSGRNPDAEQRPLPSGLDGAFDLTKIGMCGHSFGGYTTGETMYHDRRIGAGANLDGVMAHGFADPTGLPYLPGKVVEQGLDRPFLLLGTKSLPGSVPGETREHNHLTGCVDRSWPDFWGRQRGWKRDLTLCQGGHGSFNDYQVIMPQLGSLIPAQNRARFVGTLDPARSLVAQHVYLTAFFGKQLCGLDSQLYDHLLDRPSVLYPEIKLVG